MARKDNIAGRLIIGGFVLALTILVVWFALEFSGLILGDDPISPSEESSGVLLNGEDLG